MPRLAKVVGKTKSADEVTFCPAPRHQDRSTSLRAAEHRSRIVSSTWASASLQGRASMGVKEVEWHYEGGIGAFVKYLDRAKTRYPDPISVTGQRDDVGIEVAQRERQLYEQVLCSPTTSRSATADDLAASCGADAPSQQTTDKPAC